MMSALATNGHGPPVELRGLHKGFAGRPVLHGIDLKVEPGEIFVIMGPSGSGKSVLLKHVIGLEKPDAGEVLVGGESMAAEAALDRHRMAMVFQSGALLNSLTVAENVGLYLAEHRLKSQDDIDQIVTEKLLLVGLAGEGEKIPAELSGGMKKRVAIARAVLKDAPVLVLDEATSHLDAVNEQVVRDSLERLMKERTTIVIAHRLSTVRNAALIVVMDEGQVVELGTHETLLARGGLYSQLVGHQLAGAALSA